MALMEIYTVLKHNNHVSMDKLEDDNKINREIVKILHATNII